MRLVLGLVIGSVSFLVVPGSAWTARAEPAAMLALGACLLCAGFLRRRQPLAGRKPIH